MENKKRYSKLKDLTYSAFQLQSYLKDGKTSVEEKINAFKFRTKMALFGQNFRGNRECVMCPLCKIHVDSQDLVSECPILKTKITMKNKIKEIYEQDYPDVTFNHSRLRWYHFLQILPSTHQTTLL